MKIFEANHNQQQSTAIESTQETLFGSDDVDFDEVRRGIAQETTTLAQGAHSLSTDSFEKIKELVSVENPFHGQIDNAVVNISSASGTFQINVIDSSGSSTLLVLDQNGVPQMAARDGAMVDPGEVSAQIEDVLDNF